MKQSIQVNRRAIDFTWTRVINVSDMQEAQLLRILDCLEKGPNSGEAFAVVHETYEKMYGGYRPHNVLKAVMMSKTLWDDTLAANPGATLTLTEVPITDDFLYLQDRVSRVIPKLAPTQEKKHFSYVVPTGGVVTLGYSFVDSSVHTSLASVSSDGNAGEITFASGDVGATVSGTVITQPHYTVISIERIEAQPNGAHLSRVASYQPSWGVLIHPSLAATLGVSLPSF